MRGLLVMWSTRARAQGSGSGRSLLTAARTLSEPLPLAAIRLTQYSDRVADEKNLASSISALSEFTPITSLSLTTNSATKKGEGEGDAGEGEGEA